MTQILFGHRTKWIDDSASVALHSSDNLQAAWLVPLSDAPALVQLEEKVDSKVILQYGFHLSTSD